MLQELRDVFLLALLLGGCGGDGRGWSGRDMLVGVTGLCLRGKIQVSLCSTKLQSLVKESSDMSTLHWMGKGIRRRFRALAALVGAMRMAAIVVL